MLLSSCRECLIEADAMQSLCTNTVRALADAVLQIERFEHLSEKLKRLTGVVKEKISAAVATDPAMFNVLIHGDMWSNNIMFQHGDNGKVLDAIFVDYQGCYVGSPVLDIVNTFYTSSADTLRADDWNELMALYWQILNETLKKFDYSARPIPTLDELQADRKRRTHYSIYIGLFALAVRNLENVAEDEMAKLMDGADENHQSRVRMFLNPNIRKALEYLLEFFDSNRLFE